MRRDITLPERWLELVQADPEREAVVHCAAGLEPIRWTRAALWSRAEQLAGVLHERGVKAGEVCALVLKHDAEVYPLAMAVALIGAIPAILAPPNARIHPEKYRAGLTGMAERSGLDWIVTRDEIGETIAPLIEKRGAVRSLIDPFSVPPTTTSISRAHARADDPFLLQHSSGTTGLQKAVVLSHRAILEQVASCGRALDISAADKVVSWLPLYHDMGLIAALHLPLALGIPTIQLDPFEWVVAPVLLAEAIAAERATLCWMPNFAYNLMSDRIRYAEAAELDLRSMRLFINCSEPVRAASHERFLRRFARAGVTREMLGASYATAETTFAVTQTMPSAPATILSVDRDALARGIVAPTSDGNSRECVSSGVPLDGSALRVIDANGELLADDRVGELQIASTSLSSGYRNWPEKTAHAFRDGWYRSGDIGFLHDGELFVIGRKNDLIIVAGRNIQPEDVEDAVSEVDGIIPGRVVAFGIDDPALGTERVAVIAESERTSDDRNRLIAAIQRAGAAIDVTIGEVHIVPPRWLIKSSAGKLDRRANRERIGGNDWNGMRRD